MKKEKCIEKEVFFNPDEKENIENFVIAYSDVNSSISKFLLSENTSEKDYFK